MIEMSEIANSNDDRELMPIQVFVIIFSVASFIVMCFAICCLYYTTRECAINSQKTRIIPLNQPGRRIDPSELILEELPA